MLSFYDWYADLSVALPPVFDDQTDVPKFGDWWDASYPTLWARHPDIGSISAAPVGFQVHEMLAWVTRERGNSAHRAAEAVYGGSENALRHALIVLTAGSALSEHENSGGATPARARRAGSAAILGSGDAPGSRTAGGDPRRPALTDRRHRAAHRRQEAATKGRGRIRFPPSTTGLWTPQRGRRSLLGWPTEHRPWTGRPTA